MPQQKSAPPSDVTQAPSLISETDETKLEPNAQTMTEITSLLKEATDAYQTGDWAQVIAHGQAILKQAPHQPDALHLYGLALAKQQRLPEALTFFNRAIQHAPNHPLFYCNRARTYRHMRQWQQALQDYQYASRLAPRQLEVYIALAETYLEIGQPQTAIIQYLYACYLNRDQPIATHHQLGNAFLQQGAWDAALLAYEKALTLNPQSAETLSNMGVVYAEIGDLARAIRCHREALQANPQYGQAHINLGLALSQQGDFAAAEEVYQQALAQLPEQALHIHNNRGTNDKAQGNWQSARARFNQALLLDATNARARFNRGLVLLLLGDYKQGWQDYEARFELKDPNHVVLSTSRPHWQKQDLTHKTLIVYCEQGLGDTLQWVRYLPLLKQRGARIILQTQAALIPLLQSQVQLGIDQIIARENPSLPEHDYVVPLMSLSHRLNTQLSTIPANVPYLQAPSIAALPSTPSSKPYKIGIVWRGSSQHKNDGQRSIPLTTFAPLIQQPDLQCYSLQYGDNTAAEIQAAGLAHDLIDLSDQLNTWVDTANVIQALDLVITVDTSVAHLSGALGKPTWVLLPFVPDFRWLLDRSDSPWYPSMHLFRQSASCQWEPVIQAVAQAQQQQGKTLPAEKSKTSLVH